MDAPAIIANPQMMGYISLVSMDDVKLALAKNTRQVFDLLGRISTDRINDAYAPGKWTVKQILQHLIDSERVFAFRLLWFSRDPGSSLPGFDENGWALQANPEPRQWLDMVAEFEAVRQATHSLVQSLLPQDLLKAGRADDKPVNVNALAYVCAGHVAHHMTVLRDRYNIV